MKIRFKLFLILLFSIFLISCTQKKQDTSLSLDNNVYWALGTSFDTLEDAKNYNYETLKPGFKNLYEKVGKSPFYIWIKIPFTLPEHLKNKNLGFLIPYLHFSEKVWLNDEYIGQTGGFYPEPYSVLYNPHLYLLADNLIYPDEENNLYLKVLSQGLGTISEGIILDEYASAKYLEIIISFNQSKIYMIFEGILICAMALFFIIYNARKKRHFLTFSILCFCTVVFLTYFFLPELPGFEANKISYLLLTKIILCIFMFLTIFSIVSFILNFIQISQPEYFVIFKHIVLIISCFLVLIAPDFTFLMKLTLPMILTYGLHYLLALSLIYKSLSKPDKKRAAFICLAGFSPMTICILLDFILRFNLHIIKYPYFTIIGWEITITFFIIHLSLDYNKTFLQNERLNKNLKQEVDLRTLDLTKANEELSIKQQQTEKEMNMAAIVQQKYFEQPEKQYNGWQVAIDYKPLEKVSGDLFDFFTTGNNLDGTALFDASGHGVAAALITMLSKDAIRKCFITGEENKLPISQIMSQIHDSITESKGKIDNYLTGVLFRFTENPDNSSTVEFGNAGHPYPVFYSAKAKQLINLQSMETEKHYGAIAMNGIEPAFSDITFKMETGDFLVIFTDGITDIQNHKNELYGRSRLENFILQNANKTNEELLKSLNEELILFQNETPVSDDISIIILRKI